MNYDKKSAPNFIFSQFYAERWDRRIDTGTGKWNIPLQHEILGEGMHYYGIYNVHVIEEIKLFCRKSGNI